jgi:FKBP-type peptidyl-prolyl cis-trans isomerase 2
MRRACRDGRGAADVFTILLVASVLVIVALAYVVVTLPAPPASSREILYLQNGDLATFDFVGYMDTGEVFATSIEAVGENDTLYPKALIFEAPDSYVPANTSMGAGIIGAGFDGLVDDGKPFQERLLGMAIGETRIITLEPEDAFGPRDPALVESRALVETLPLKETITAAEYNTRFLQQPVADQTILDPFWSWPVRVLDYDTGSGLVTFRMEPTVGMIVSPYKTFDTRVESVDTAANGGEGVVQVRHLLSEEDAGNVIARGLQGGFIVTQVDTAAGTFVADFNDLRSGHQVTYVISLLDIRRA